MRRHVDGANNMEKFKWLVIEPGLIGLHGFPIQVKRTPPPHIGGTYILLVNGSRAFNGYCNTLAFAKQDGELKATELIEMGLT